jgi:beta-galactosidase
METQPGFVNYMPVNVCLDPGETRRMVWHQVGHGADGVLFWQWRSSFGGLEQWHGTLVGADGRPRPVYDEVARAGRELKALQQVLDGTAVRPRVALAWSYRDRAVVETCPFHKDYDAWHHWRDQYGALRRWGLDVEALRADQGLAGYDLLFAPQMLMLDPGLEDLLVGYVQGGGHLVLGPRSGFVNADGALLPSRAPGAKLSALAGGHSVEHYSLPAAIPVAGEFMVDGKALIWAEWLQADAADTQTILRYGPGHAWLVGKSAALTRKVGKGRITLLGAWLDMPGMVAMAQWACQQAGVPMPWGRLPDGVEVSCRQGPARRIHVICNHGAQDRQLRLPFAAVCAFSGKTLETCITVPANEIFVAHESC